MSIEFIPVSDILREHMKKRKLSQYKVAEKCVGITRSYVGDVLTKRTLASKNFIEQFIKVIDLTEEEERILWESWMFERGDKKTLMYLKEIELKYFELISKQKIKD